MLVLVLEAPLDIAAGEYSLAETLMLHIKPLLREMCCSIHSVNYGLIDRGRVTMVNPILRMFGQRLYVKRHLNNCRLFAPCSNFRDSERLGHGRLLVAYLGDLSRRSLCLVFTRSRFH